MDLYPILPGLSFSKIRKPSAGNTIVQTSASGKRVVFKLRSRPIWQYELHYNVLRHNLGRGIPLRGQYDNAIQVVIASQLLNSAALIENELSVLEGFFLRQQGRANEWYFDDYNDDTVGLYLCAVGDGQSSTFQTPFDSSWQALFPTFSLWTDNSPYYLRSSNSFAKAPGLTNLDANGLITVPPPILPPGTPIYITAQTGSQIGPAPTYSPIYLLGEVFAIANGTATTYQLTRQVGSTAAGYQEPITEINNIAGIWDNGSPAGAHTVVLNGASGTGGQVTFSTPPLSGHYLTWAGKYYFRCAFMQDTNEFEEFAAKLWQMKQLEFEQVLKMSAAITPQLQAYLLQNGSYAAIDLYQFKLVDGTVLYLTSWDRDVTYGAQVYSSLGPRMQRGTVKWTRGVEVTELDVMIYYDATDIADLGLTYGGSVVAGLWDGAQVVLSRVYDPPMLPNGCFSADLPVFVTGFGSVVLGSVNLFTGHTSRAPSVGRTALQISFASLTDLLNVQVPRRTYKPVCSWILFDGGCTLLASNFQTSGTVQSNSTTLEVFSSTIVVPNTGIPNAGLTAPDDWLDLGQIAFTSGQNKGLVRMIEEYLGAGLKNYQNSVMQDGPSLYAPLAANADDISGNGYNGTVSGGVTFGETGGLDGDTSKSALFDGSTGFITFPIPAPNTLANTDASLTIEMIINAPPGTVAGLFSTGATPKGAYHPLQAVDYAFTEYDVTGPGFDWYPAGPFVPFNITASVWLHLAVIFRGANFIDVFLNGALAASGSATGAGSYTWTDFYLGTALGGAEAAQFFGGYIMNLAIYNYQLPPNRINAHAQWLNQAPFTVTTPYIKLFQPTIYTPAPGDAFTALPGCDHTYGGTCLRKFNNKTNFGGFPFIPQDEAVF